MKISLGEWIAIFGLVAGLMSALWAAIASFHGSKRDLAHVKRNAEQAKLAFKDMAATIDQMEIDISKLNTIINFLLVERGDSHSSILGHKPRER